MPFWEKMKIYNLHKEGFSKEELAIGWEVSEDTISQIVGAMKRREKRRELQRSSAGAH